MNNIKVADLFRQLANEFESSDVQIIGSLDWQIDRLVQLDFPSLVNKSEAEFRDGFKKLIPKAKKLTKPFILVSPV